MVSKAGLRLKVHRPYEYETITVFDMLKGEVQLNFSFLFEAIAVHPFLKLLLLFVLWFAVSAAGGVLTASSVGTWYPDLIKPPLNPPNWVFAPVWTTLYTVLAIVGWRIWMRPELHSQPYFKLWRGFYGLNALLNVAWSATFFGLQSPLFGLITIVLLLDAIAILIWLTGRLDKTSALLLLPYLAWVGFATYLNFGLYVYNR